MPQTTGIPDRATSDSRPEPVVYAARIGGLLAALLVSVGGVIAILAAGLTLDELGPLGIAVGAVITAAVALGVYLLPVWQALRARAKVTPLDDPRDDDGAPLTPDTDADLGRIARRLIELAEEHSGGSLPVILEVPAEQPSAHVDVDEPDVDEPDVDVDPPVDITALRREYHLDP